MSETWQPPLPPDNSNNNPNLRPSQVPKKKKTTLNMFKSILNGAKKLATGGVGDSSTPAADELFPKVDPAVDGEDCLRDCESCPAHYPRTFKIDEDDDLYGGVKGWSTHVLVATGKTDWVRDVADEKGSVMQVSRRPRGLVMV